VRLRSVVRTAGFDLWVASAGRWFLLLLPVLVVAAALNVARAEIPGHGGPIRGIAISADGMRALTAGFDYSVIEWDTATVRPLRRLIGHEAGVNAVAYLPSGRAVSASDDGTVAIWNLADGTRIHSLTGHGAKVTAIAVSPDGTLIASAGWDRTVRLWDAESGAGLRTLEHQANVNAVVFSADGKKLVSAGHDGNVIVWNPVDGTQRLAFGSSGFPVGAMALAPDGRSLFVASADMTVRTWDIETGRESAAPQRHGAPILALAVSAEGTAAVGDLHGSVRLWRLDDPLALRSIAGNGGPVWAIGLTPDGARVVTAEAEAGLHIWDVESGRLLGPATETADAAPAASDPGPGAQLFRKCAICHSVSADGGGRAGPTLYGVFGRRAGTVPGYPYSGALRDSDVVWTEATLDDLFEQGPDRMTPGSKMPLQRIPNAHERAELIAYLKRITSP
jgi:cytochrome c